MKQQRSYSDVEVFKGIPTHFPILLFVFGEHKKIESILGLSNSHFIFQGKFIQYGIIEKIDIIMSERECHTGTYL